MRLNPDTIAASNAHRVLRFGQSRGLHAPELAKSLPHPTEGEARILASEMFALWEQLARTLRASDLSIDIARRSRLEDLGALGTALVCAPTLLEVFQTFVRYSSLLSQAGSWRIEMRGPWLELHWVSAQAPRLGVRLSRETAFAQMVNGVRRLGGDQLGPVDVSFRHRAPAHTAAHRAFFDCPLSFDAPHDMVRFRREVAASVPVTADRVRWAAASSALHALQARLGRRSHEARVRDEVDRRLSAGEPPRIVSIARTLGSSERALRRALAEEAVSFSSIVDDARRLRAELLLAQPGVSIARAGVAAGFTDASAFTHACRRWFGRTPRQVARRARSTTE